MWMHQTNRIAFRSNIPQHQFLSNFSSSTIKLTTVDNRLRWRNLEFPHNEQYYCFEKAIFAGNHEVAERVLATANPRDSKTVGKPTFKITDYTNKVIYQKRRDDTWDSLSFFVMVGCTFDKFVQNPDLQSKLLATGDAELIEFSNDKWGGKLTMQEIRDGIPCREQNRLGNALMAVRHFIRFGAVNLPEKIFIGDSMIKKVSIPGYHKFHVSGATTEVLGTLMLCLAKPWVKQICFMGGTNDCPLKGLFEKPEYNSDGTPKTHVPHRIAKKLEMFIQLAMEKAPHATFHICEILPRHHEAKPAHEGPGPSQMQRTVASVNAKYRKFCDKLGERVRLISYGNAFDDPSLFETGSVVEFHPNIHGSARLQQIIRNLLS